MTSYFRATFEDGAIEVRSTQTRPYVACFEGPYGVSWTASQSRIPLGARWAAAEAIDAKTYRAILAAREVERAGGETEAALVKARDALRRAQQDQAGAMRCIEAARTVLDSQDEQRLRQWGGAERAREYLIEAQQKQARAYGRIEKARRDLAKLEALTK